MLGEHGGALTHSACTTVLYWLAGSHKVARDSPATLFLQLSQAASMPEASILLVFTIVLEAPPGWTQTDCRDPDCCISYRAWEAY